MQPRTAERVRAAISQGSYRQADDLLADYRLEVEAAYRAARTAEERTQVATEVTAFLRWCRESVLASRAHTQARLIHLTRQSAYSEPTFSRDVFSMNG